MTFTIGRASFDNNPSALRQSGDRLSLDIDILPSTLAEAKVLRQQVLGLENNADEPVVPLTWSADSDLDGFYRVIGVDVEPVQSYLSNKLMRSRIDLERVGGGRVNPIAEVQAVAAVRSNSHSITAVTPRIFVPSAALSWLEYPTGWTYVSDLPWTGQDNKLMLSMLQSSPSLPTSAVFTHGLRPDTYYTLSCKIEQQVGGSWYPVVGDQIPSGATLRVNNGFVRFTLANVSDRLTLTGEGWNLTSQAWNELPEALELFDNAASGTGDVDSSAGVFNTILRNDPETVVLRVDCNGGTDNGATYSPWRVDIKLRRGCPFVELTIQSGAPNGGLAPGWRADAVTACSAVTGGIERTSYDANGWKWGAVMTEAVTTDTTNGYVYRSATDTTVYSCVYTVFDHANQWTSAQAREAYWMTTSVKSEVVAR